MGERVSPLKSTSTLFIASANLLRDSLRSSEKVFMDSISLKSNPLKLESFIAVIELSFDKIEVNLYCVTRRIRTETLSLSWNQRFHLFNGLGFSNANLLSLGHVALDFLDQSWRDVAFDLLDEFGRDVEFWKSWNLVGWCVVVLRIASGDDCNSLLVEESCQEGDNVLFDVAAKDCVGVDSNCDNISNVVV